MVVSGSKKQDGDGGNAEFKASKQQSTNQWVVSQELRPLLDTIYCNNSNNRQGIHKINPVQMSHPLVVKDVIDAVTALYCCFYTVVCRCFSNIVNASTQGAETSSGED